MQSIWEAGNCFSEGFTGRWQLGVLKTILYNNRLPITEIEHTTRVQKILNLSVESVDKFSYPFILQNQG